MIIIDLKGFQYDKNIFRCMEISVLNTDNGYYLDRFVRTPTDISKYCRNIRAYMNYQNYVTKNIHGIEWKNEDNLDY